MKGFALVPQSSFPKTGTRNTSIVTVFWMGSLSRVKDSKWPRSPLPCGALAQEKEGVGRVGGITGNQADATIRVVLEGGAEQEVLEGPESGTLHDMESYLENQSVRSAYNGSRCTSEFYHWL